jgi:hypothetical protein
LPISR